MSKDKVVTDDTVGPALQKFRGDPNDPEERWIVLGYSDGKNTLTVVASGAGGLSDAAQNFTDDDARYCLLRKVHKVEMATTIKYGFVDWTPDTVKPMRKALLSTHKGQVQEILKPYHVSLQAANRSELNENEILTKISDSSGTSMHVTDQKQAVRATPKSPKAHLVPASVREEQTVIIENEEEVKEAIKDVRNDASDTNWALVGYKDIKTLILLGKGSGGIDELASKLDDQQVFYALFRVTETVDKSVTVKFCFLKLLSDHVKPTDRAKISTHLGFVHKLFEPFHIEFLLDSRSEFTTELVTQRLRDNMFLDSRVRDADFKAQSQAKKSVASGKGPSVAQGGGAINIDDEVKKALHDVHTNDGPISWVVLSYAAKHTLTLHASGNGGAEELINALEESNVNFGLLRIIEQIDKSKTVKFVYIKWQPESVAPMKKAEISVNKGAIDDLFRPFHVDLFVSNKNEISQQVIMDKVAAASGSKSHIVD